MTIVSDSVKLSYHIDKAKDFLNFELFDKTYNVDTLTDGFLDLYNKENIYGVYPDWERNDDLYTESNGYQTAAIEHLNEMYTILTNLVDIKEYSFIDVGSGKGKVLINNIINNYLYKNNIGIEIDKNLHNVALKNFKSISSKFNISNIYLYNEDILNYTCLNEPSIYFFFNPFSFDIYKKFLIKNKQTFKQNKTIIAQLYPFYPTKKENTEFFEFPIEENMGFFNKIYFEKYYLIYSSK